MVRPFHPETAYYRLSTQRELDILAGDIRVNGQLEPITIHPDNSILSGRRRALACQQLGIEPIEETWNGKPGTEFDFVRSKNNRRNDGPIQRALSAARYATMKQGARTDLNNLKDDLYAQAKRFREEHPVDDPSAITYTLKVSVCKACQSRSCDGVHDGKKSRRQVKKIPVAVSRGTTYDEADAKVLAEFEKRQADDAARGISLPQAAKLFDASVGSTNRASILLKQGSDNLIAAVDNDQFPLAGCGKTSVSHSIIM